MPKKYKTRNQFRFSKNKKAVYHPHYIFGEKDDKYISLGLTTHPKKNHKVFLLNGSPGPQSGKKQYIHKKAFVMPKNNYTKKRLKGWAFSAEDMALIRYLKKKYKRSK